MKKFILLFGLCLIIGLVSILPVNAASRFLVACTTACTWDGSNTAIWSATSGGAGGQSVPGSADTVTLDAATCVGGLTCTITVNTTVSVQTLTIGACTAATTGCILDFSANNNNVTLSGSNSFSGTGTGTRTLNMGNGTWTLQGSSSAWNMSTVTGLTFNANSSTILISNTTATQKLFLGGGLTYNIVSIAAGVAANLGHIGFSTANTTIATLLVAAPNYLVFPSTQTYNITNAMVLAGSSGNEITIVGSAVSSLATLSTTSGAATFTWSAFRDIAFTGGATFTATNSTDLGHNTGITITPPSGGGSAHIIGG